MFEDVIDEGFEALHAGTKMKVLVDPANPMDSLRNVIVILLVTIALKNFFVWFAGQLGVQLQETQLTEKGTVVNGRGDTPNMHDILTGSRPDGTAFDGADLTCGNWTSNSSGRAQVVVGEHASLGSGPTRHELGGEDEERNREQRLIRPAIDPGERGRVPDLKAVAVVAGDVETLVVGRDDGAYSRQACSRYATTFTILWGTTMIFFGANDGMIHAIDARTGYEVWAFIPYNLLPKLRALYDGQPVEQFDYFVDSSPKLAEVKVNGSWRSLLLIGQGNGGTFYQALDVTLSGNTLTRVYDNIRNSYESLLDKRLNVGVDIYNLMNSSAVLNYNTAFNPGGTWLTPTSVVGPRFAKVSASVEF